ncbi:hypothetical protein SAMN06295900_11419 [Trinickia caryophylli]|uniref:Uncharacterized protein n=1 Tax=Trinickia caryophylli TaxID=28094 RepID=A0A1X7G7G4_TRICW|nr:hypothetical protein SAMN06295900_11419 [Trinickia caryophylli]
MTNAFDLWFIAAMSRLSAHAPWMTHAVESLAEIYLFKGPVLVALLVRIHAELRTRDAVRRVPRAGPRARCTRGLELSASTERVAVHRAAQPIKAIRFS